MPDKSLPDEPLPDNQSDNQPNEPAELSPVDEARVRRLLADARHTEPMPADVVARLDATLADLALEAPLATTAAAPAVVTDLDARRRRRRRGATFLVAAAAVTAFGVSAGPLLQNLGTMSGSDSASTTDSAGDNRESVGRGGLNADKDDLGASPARSDAPEAELGPESMRDYGVEGPLPTSTINPNAFRSQAEALSESAAMYALDAVVGRCPGVRSWGQGRALPAAYAGKMGLLVFRTPQGQRQRVDLYLCGSLQPARSTLIPLP